MQNPNQQETNPYAHVVVVGVDGAGGWFINMPANGTATSVANAAVLTLTADDISAGKGTFKVYDDGGKDGYYSHGYSGYLIVTTPEGYKVQLSGSVATESCCDYLTAIRVEVEQHTLFAASQRTDIHRAFILTLAQISVGSRTIVNS